MEDEGGEEEVGGEEGDMNPTIEERILSRLARGPATFAEIRRDYGSASEERAIDRSLQRLRRQGAICFDKTTRRWTAPKIGETCNEAGSPDEDPALALRVHDVVEHALGEASHYGPQVPEGVSYAILRIFCRVGVWTSGRFDQHLRHQLGDGPTDAILAWLSEHVSPRLGKGEDGVPRYVAEGPVSMAKEIYPVVVRGPAAGDAMPVGDAAAVASVAVTEWRLKAVEDGLKFLLERFDEHERGAKP